MKRYSEPGYKNAVPCHQAECVQSFTVQVYSERDTLHVRMIYGSKTANHYSS